jgi:hypothetical protein
MKRDLPNDVILPAIGAIILFVAWRYGWLSWEIIKVIIGLS